MALTSPASRGRSQAGCFAAFGAELQRKLDEYRNSGLSIGVMGEALSHCDNHVRISQDVVDAWGIPALHVDTRYTENELNMSRDAGFL